MSVFFLFFHSQSSSGRAHGNYVDGVGNDEQSATNCESGVRRGLMGISPVATWAM